MVSSVSLKELIRRFRRLGYLGPFSGGKHQCMIKGRKKIRIPNPHGTKDIHVSLLKEILRQAGVTEEEWNNT